MPTRGRPPVTAPPKPSCFGNVRRLADQILGPEVDRRFPEEAAKLRTWGLNRYLDVSLLEAPLLLAGVGGSPWFGEAGRSWWLGQNRSDPVTSTDDAAATEVLELIQEQLRRGAVSRIQAEMAQPKPWQTEDWHALQAAKDAGWEVEARGPVSTERTARE